MRFFLVFSVVLCSVIVKVRGVDCNACGYSCRSWDFSCPGKKAVCKSYSAILDGYLSTVEANCANDPSRHQGRQRIAKAQQLLFDTGLASSEDFRGVQIRFCRQMQIRIPEVRVDLGADGLVPDHNKILLHTSTMGWGLIDLAALLFHELHHIKQYRAWGGEGFRCRYWDALLSCRCDGRGNRVENDAYGEGDRAEKVLRGRNIYLKNDCHKTIQVAIRFKDPASSQWVSRCWYQLNAGQGFYTLGDDGRRVGTRNKIWYFYAESLDGSALWHGAGLDGSIVRSCRGRSLSMRELSYVSSDDDLYLSLTCTRRRVLGGGNQDPNQCQAWEAPADGYVLSLEVAKLENERTQSCVNTMLPDDKLQFKHDHSSGIVPTCDFKDDGLPCESFDTEHEGLTVDHDILSPMYTNETDGGT